MDGFMTVKEASEKWGISQRRINTLCQNGRLSGTIKFGKAWAIPSDTVKPDDLRIKSGKYIKKKQSDIIC